MVSLWRKNRKILPSCTIHNERYNRSSLGRCSGIESKSYFRERWSKATVSYNSSYTPTTYTMYCRKYSREEIKSIYRRYGHNHWLHMDWSLIPFYQCDADIDQNIDRSWTIGQTGRILFSAEDYTNMSYYNWCDIRPKHSNISKRVGEGVFTICVVLDQSTVIFQKRGGGGGVLQFVWYWDKNSGNTMLCFISWLLICRVCSHPRRFSISITNQ